jgi:hypothetical protein
MRTLILGIPLPHTTFDNYSFLSAPSLFDHDHIVVDMSAVSDVVEQVVGHSQEHHTFDGQTVVNGPSIPSAFSLAELLRLRRLEADRLLARGGVVVSFTYPDIAHQGIHACPTWRRYDWLPAAEGLSWTQHLIAGYGKLGVELTDDGHPFAPYVEEFGARLAFRAYFSQQQESLSQDVRVFARSPGGAAVGLELAVGRGQIILLPPMGGLDDRAPLANALHRCLERMQGTQEEQPPQWIRKEAL